MQAVEAGEIPRNHQILREIAGLCSRLPIGSDSTAGTKFLKNTNDALLISYMAMMTKGFNAMSEVSGVLATISRLLLTGSNRGRPLVGAPLVPLVSNPVLPLGLGLGRRREGSGDLTGA